MIPLKNFKELSFLVYGLGITGKSVINFFKKNNFENYDVWDDNKKIQKKRRPLELEILLKKVNYIILSPGVSLQTSKHKYLLIKYEKKIITDIDLIFIFKKFGKSIVVTGTNGKSTTCKILYHLLKKNNHNALLGGNIGTPILSLNIKKDSVLVIEASSFQLSHSKFISPDYAFLLNITNDHLDWHGNMRKYINAKFKIFEGQKRNQFSLCNKKLKSIYIKKNLSGKLIVPKLKSYLKLKPYIENSYIASDINNENMSYVFELSKLFKISKKSFLNSLKNFSGLEHRYEIFLKKNNCIFINDSKATSFQSTKFALKNSTNIFWIVGGKPKKNDKIILKHLKKNIVKSYIIGKDINFFQKQLKHQINYEVVKSIKNSIKKILKDVKFYKKKNNTVLLSPASASFDQFRDFEERGKRFKQLCKYYAK